MSSMVDVKRVKTIVLLAVLAYQLNILKINTDQFDSEPLFSVLTSVL